MGWPLVGGLWHGVLDLSYKSLTRQSAVAGRATALPPRCPHASRWESRAAGRETARLPSVAQSGGDLEVCLIVSHSS